MGAVCTCTRGHLALRNEGHFINDDSSRSEGFGRNGREKPMYDEKIGSADGLLPKMIGERKACQPMTAITSEPLGIWARLSIVVFPKGDVMCMV